MISVEKFKVNVIGHNWMLVELSWVRLSWAISRYL